MQHEKWSDLVHIVLSALKSSVSNQLKNLEPITIFTGLEAKGPVSTFRRSESNSTITLTKVKPELSINLTESNNRLLKLHQMVGTALQANRDLERKSVELEDLHRFTEVDFVLVARNEFFSSEKLELRWTGTRRVVKALRDFVFIVEDFRNGSTDYIHACRHRFYFNSALNTEAILPHVIWVTYSSRDPCYVIKVI